LNIEFVDEIRKSSKREKTLKLKELEDKVAYLRQHMNDLSYVTRDSGLDSDSVEVLNYLINKENEGRYSAEPSAIASYLNWDVEEVKSTLNILALKDLVVKFSQGRLNRFCCNKLGVKLLNEGGKIASTPLQ